VDASYEGKQLIGIDVHRRRSVLVRMSEAGEKARDHADQQRADYLRER